MDAQAWTTARHNPDKSPLRRSAAGSLFILVAPFLYAAYALLTPPFQTPDEHQHLFRAWQLSELQIVGERRADRAGGILPDSLAKAALPELGNVEPHASRPIITRPFSSLFRSGTPTVGQRHFFNFFGSVIYSPAGYIPQMIAIWIGNPLGLSVENILRVGRLLNAAVTIVLIYFAIRLTPAGSLALASVGLLPMTAASSASFGQDGLVIGGAAVLMALGLRIIMKGRWQLSDIFIVGTLATFLTLSKALYLPLAIIGGQPLVRRSVEWRRLLVPSLICCIAVLLTAVWLHAVSDLAIAPRAGIPSVNERLAGWQQDPGSLAILLERTFVGHGLQLFDTLFTFGWLNIGPVRPAEFLSVAAFLIVILAGDPSADLLRWQTRLWLTAIAASVVVLISVAMCLYFTRNSDTWIQGLQGRYFIPILPLLLTACLPKRAGELRYRAIVTVLLVTANLISLAAIVRAFYSF